MNTFKRFIVDPKETGFLFFKKFRNPTENEFMEEVGMAQLQIAKTICNDPSDDLTIKNKRLFRLITDRRLDIRELYQKFLAYCAKSNSPVRTVYMDISFNPDDIENFCIAIFNTSGIGLADTNLPIVKVTLESKKFRETANSVSPTDSSQG